MKSEIIVIGSSLAVWGFFSAFQKIRNRIPGWKNSEAYADFVRSARKRGLTNEQMYLEYRFRLALTRTRRIVSERAVHHPGQFREILREVAAQESLAMDKKSRKKFMDIALAETSEFLFDDARKAVEAYDRKSLALIKALIHDPHDDHYNAMRTKK